MRNEFNAGLNTDLNERAETATDLISEPMHAAPAQPNLVQQFDKVDDGSNWADFELDKLASQIRQKHESILGSVRRTTAEAAEAGRLLTTANEKLAAPGRKGHGFNRWVQERCGISRQTAYNYMDVYERSKDRPGLLNLRLTQVYEDGKSDTGNPFVDDSPSLEHDDDDNPPAKRGKGKSRSQGEVTPVFNPVPDAPQIVEQQTTASSLCVLSPNNWKGEIMSLLADEKTFERHARRVLAIAIRDDANAKTEDSKEGANHES